MSDTVKQDFSPHGGKPAIRSGMKLQYFRAGSETPSVGDSSVMNLIVAVCEAVLQCKQFRISENTLVVTGVQTKTTATSNFQGVYVPSTTYGLFDEVVIQTGAGTGEYVSTSDNNNNDPRTGINWIQTSSLNQWF